MANQRLPCFGILPFSLHERRTRIVLKHEATAVNARLILAPAPVRIQPLVLPASATLFRVEMIALVVQVDGALAAVTPDDRLMRLIDFDLEGHIAGAGSF